MASRIHRQELVDKPLRGDGARVLLVNKNPEDLSYYGGLLQGLQCQVRTSSSFAKGGQCLKREHYDLIVLDQGSSRFEGRQVLMTAMEVDTEVPVLVLARGGLLRFSCHRHGDLSVAGGICQTTPFEQDNSNKGD